MAPGSTRTHIVLYLLAVGALSAVTIGLLYAVFTAGLPAGIEAFLADPPGTVRERPLGIFGIASVFVMLFVLIAAIVFVGAQHMDQELDEKYR